MTDVVAAPQAVHVTAQSHPMRESSVRHFGVVEGRTLAQIVAEAGVRPGAAIGAWVDGRRVPVEIWGETTPHSGQVVVVKVLAFGGGGEGGKQTGRILAMVALLVIMVLTAGATAPLLGITAEAGYSAGTIAAVNAAGTAVIGIAGNLAVNAIFPPPGFSGGTLDTSKASPLLTATRNRARPYEKLPRCYGTHRMYPDLAAETWVEHHGAKSYLRLLFCCGRGPLELSDLRIGNDALFAANTAITYTGVMRGDGATYKAVQVEIRQGRDDDAPITLYPRDIHTEALQLKLVGRRTAKTVPIGSPPTTTANTIAEDDAKNARTSTTERDTSEIVVELTWPQGLIFNKDMGGSRSVLCKVRLEYRAVGATAWTPFPDDTEARVSGGVATIEAESATPVFRGYIAKPAAAGQWEVRCTRITPIAGDAGQIDETYWTALRSIKAGTPVTKRGLCLVAMRIKATDQIQGTVDQFSALAKSVLRRWTGSAWVTEATGNAAAVYLHLLTSGETRIAYADADVDMTGLKAAMVRCQNTHRECNLVFEGRAILAERLKVVAATMRASFAMLDAKPSLLFDDEPSTPAQVFSPDNSHGFKGTKVFADLPHALKCKFRDPAKDYELVEQIVYADGYNADGTGGKTAATKFDEMEFPGWTNPRLVWMDARYHLAVARLRPESFEISTDFEHLAVRRGAYVLLSHDVIDTGLASARVREAQIDGSGRCTAVVLDRWVTIESAGSYGVVVRKSTTALTTVARQVTSAIASYLRLEFSTPIAATDPHPAEGDLLVFGVLGSETLEVLVRSIVPQDDLAARLTFVPLARDVYDADQGTPPEWAVDRIAGDVVAGSREPTDTPAAPVVLAVTPTKPKPPAVGAAAAGSAGGSAKTTASLVIQAVPPAGPKRTKPGKGGKK